MSSGAIHDEHPFVPPPEQRDPVRLLRGRLVAPVTIFTAGDDPAGWTGLTVSSLVVAEGDPPLLYCLLGPTTDLVERIAQTDRFLVHVCEIRSPSHRRRLRRFGAEPGRAVRRPPGDPDRSTARCSTASGRPQGAPW